jgi:hypothetical protein
MDALVLEIFANILTAFSMVLPVWGGWLCIGGALQGRTTG